jgi:hypothetical protein
MDEDSRKNYISNDYNNNEYDTDEYEYLDEEEQNQIFQENIFDLAVDIRFDLNEYTSKDTLSIGEFLNVNDLVQFLNRII